MGSHWLNRIRRHLLVLAAGGGAAGVCFEVAGGWLLTPIAPVRQPIGEAQLISRQSFPEACTTSLSPFNAVAVDPKRNEVVVQGDVAPLRVIQGDKTKIIRINQMQIYSPAG